MSHRSQSTIELVRLAQAGDSGAGNELASRYSRRLRIWARGRLPNRLRPSHDTGDIVQVALANTFKNLKTIDLDRAGAFWSYLRTAVINGIIDLVRQHAGRGEPVEIPDDMPARGPSPLDKAIGAENRAWFEGALTSLDTQEQALIFLRLELGLTHQEVADEIGMPSADAARVAFKRAVVRLQDEMRRTRPES